MRRGVALAAMPLILLALFAVGRAAADAEVDESDVIVLTDKAWSSVVPQEDLMLVEFYAPWCGHCKRLTPEYAKAATILKNENPPIKLAKVDATEEKEMAGKFGVNGYPTLKVFRNGEATEYNGPREAAGIVKYMRNQAGPSSTEFKTAAELEKFIERSEPVVVGFFADAKSAEAKAFQAAANGLRENFKFGHSHAGEVLDKYGYRQSVVLFKPYDDKQTVFTGTVTKNNLEDWIYQNNLPLAGVITRANSDLYQRKGNAVLRVVVPVNLETNKKQADYYLNRLRKVAKDFPKISFTIADKGEWAGENDKFGLTGKEKEAVVIVDATGRMKYKSPSEKFSVESVKEFARAFTAGEVKPYIKSEAVPAPAKKGEVAVVVGENFNDIVLDKSKDVLIEFYAPWCGHCKSLAPKYDKLAKELEDVDSLVIAKFDATANDSPHPAYNARGYPTILFAPANNKENPIKYEGEREVKAFKKWLKQKASVPFTLKKN